MPKHLPPLLIALAMLTPAAEAQPLRFWVGGGIGGSADGRGLGPSARADAHILLGRVVVGGRLAANYGGDSGYTSRYDLGGDEVARNYYAESALLVGYALRNAPRFQLIVGAGPASVKMKRILGNDSDDFELENLTLKGLAAETGLYGRFSRNVGYGLIFYGNINEEQPFVGVTAGLMLGKLW